MMRFQSIVSVDVGLRFSSEFLFFLMRRSHFDGFNKFPRSSRFTNEIKMLL